MVDNVIKPVLGHLWNENEICHNCGRSKQSAQYLVIDCPNGPPDIIQILNPKTKRYTAVDRKRGVITAHKRTPGPYKNIPIVKPKGKQNDEKM